MHLDSLDDLSELPDFAALQQLAGALWREAGERGAAVLVGAGFSRNALLRSAGAAPPPLWSELASAMASALYPEGQGAPRDALRLAEEYRIYFGQAALNDLMQASLPDAAWLPGPAHQALLTLPWAEVLTTNFDTLLERASEEVVNRNYQAVRSEGDLARFSAPRIVKLHGTIGVDDALVIAEEDFRTYPARKAAFVNLARQVFIENELCLFGFSGDDPNFLAWSGWVRDHLGGSARRIYLIGALNLSPSRRRLLEARNISPIDLWPLVKHLDPADRESNAVDRVLDFLSRSAPAKPYDWLPGETSPFHGFDARQAERRDPTLGARRLRDLADVWRADRRTWPGWLTPPVVVRRSLRESLDEAPALTDRIEDALAPGERVDLGREYLWRHAKAYLPLDTDDALRIGRWLQDAGPQDMERAGRLEMATSLMRHARYASDGDLFERWAGFIEALAAPGDDALAAVAWQRCEWARDRLDYAGIEASLDSVVGTDPAWLLRSAGLLAELGRTSEAADRAATAVADLRRRRRTAPSSLWIMSRLAWAEWMSAALRQDRTFQWEEWGHLYREWKTDPYEALEELHTQARNLADRQREKSRKMILSFEEGHYRDPSTTIHFSREVGATAFFKIRRLLEDSGVPLRLRHSSLAAEPFVASALVNSDGSANWHMLVLRGLGRAGDVRYNALLSRLAVARLDGAASAAVLRQVFAAIDYWRVAWALGEERRSAALDHLPFFLETAARLVVRASPEDAREGFRLAMAVAHDRAVAHHAVYEPLDHLARNAIRALPASGRTALAQAVLDFPLPSSAAGSAFRWPAASAWLDRIDLPVEPERLGWNQVVDRLIAAVAGPDPKDRAEASLRLARLALAGHLSSDQADRLGRALWSQLDAGTPALPEGTSLFASMFARLPHPPGIDARARVRARIFVQLSTLADVPLLDEWTAAARPYLADRRMGPTPRQAAIMFDGLVAWRPPPSPKSAAEALHASFSGQSAERIPRALGPALEVAIAPWMAPEDRTADRLAALLALLEMDEVGFGLGALVWFLGVGEDERIVERLRQGLLSRDFLPVAGACDALQTWLNRRADWGVPSPMLVEQALVLFEGGHGIGLHILARTLRKLLAADGLSPAQSGRLDPALGRLGGLVRYDRVEAGGRAEVSASLIRSECVRLSRALEDHGLGGPHARAWLEAAINDPLPEVRDALEAGRRKIQVPHQDVQP